MTDRTQPPRLKGLKWHDQKPTTKAERVLMWFGIITAGTSLVILIGSFF